MKKFIVLLSLSGMLLFVGCGGNALTKSCKSLTKVNNYIGTAYVQARTAHNADPNLVSLDYLETLEKVQDVISVMAGTTCFLENTFDEIEDKI